jgi:hypothetical protein
MSFTRLTYCLISLLAPFKTLHAQTVDSTFYKNEYRYVFTQPGLSVVHNFNQDFGIELSGNYVFLGLNRSFPFAQNTNIPVSNVENGQGYALDVSARLRADNHLTFSAGFGYRFFDVKSNWVTTSASMPGKNYTEYRLSEKTNTCVAFLAFNFHNNINSRFGSEFGIRLGVGNGICQTDVAEGREWQHGYQRPIDLTLNPIPFAEKVSNNVFYFSFRYAVGLRCNKHSTPLHTINSKSGSWISRHLEH